MVVVAVVEEEAEIVGGIGGWGASRNMQSWWSLAVGGMLLYD